MTKKIVWRLKEQPTPGSLGELVKEGLLTKDEAREILFNSETEDERDKKSLESEIKFLRELVEKLSNNNNSKIVEIIREVEIPWRKYDWYKPYVIWSTGNSITYSSTTECVNTTNATSSFSDI